MSPGDTLEFTEDTGAATLPLGDGVGPWGATPTRSTNTAVHPATAPNATATKPFLDTFPFAASRIVVPIAFPPRPCARRRPAHCPVQLRAHSTPLRGIQQGGAGSWPDGVIKGAPDEAVPRVPRPAAP